METAYLSSPCYGGILVEKDVYDELHYCAVNEKTKKLAAESHIRVLKHFIKEALKEVIKEEF